MTLVGAVATVQMPAEAAELAYTYIDAAYRSADSRVPDEHGGLPGVTREYHRVVGTAEDGGVQYANAGIEGYGWGALSIHLLMRYLLGLREEETRELTIIPALPRALRREGAVYRVAPIQWGNYVLSVQCTVQATDGYIMQVSCSASEGYIFSGSAASQEQQEWEGKWGEERKLQLPQLTKSKESIL